MHFLLLASVVYPFLHFGFPSNAENRVPNPNLQEAKLKLKLRTHRNTVDRRHQRAHGKVARRASPRGQPREGRNHFGILVRESHLGSHRR